MLGAIVGDIVGSRFEFNNHRSKDFELFTTKSFVTDDSIMTLAVAEALMNTYEETDAFLSSFDQTLSRQTVQAMQAIGRPYPACGYGGRFFDWMYDDDPKPYESFGNGAAMRISPVGFLARTESEAKRWSAIITSVSHNHVEGIKGAEATVIAIFLARHGATIDAIRKRIEKNYYRLDFSIDEIRPTYQFNETCQDTVPQAIECFLESTSFEDALRIGVSVGGDTDTLCAITGALAEAYYGVPDEIAEIALSYLDARLKAVYDRWQHFLAVF